jgi:hypothetical protein
VAVVLHEGELMGQARLALGGAARRLGIAVLDQDPRAWIGRF